MKYRKIPSTKNRVMTLLILFLVFLFDWIRKVSSRQSFIYLLKHFVLLTWVCATTVNVCYFKLLKKSTILCNCNQLELEKSINLGKYLEQFSGYYLSKIAIRWKLCMLLIPLCTKLLSYMNMFWSFSLIILLLFQW